ncbi:MAG: NAD/NADP octopine/nopaline dehydrogenase family protein [Solirubrobacterales bacterium]
MSSSVGEFEAVVAGLAADRRASEPAASPTIGCVAVVGAGPVGQAVACASLAAGCTVRLHAAYEAELASLREAGAITVRGEELVGTYELDGNRGPSIEVRPSIDGAIGEADAVVLATPAVAHQAYAGLLAPLLNEGQIIVLLPGRAFGAVEFARGLRRLGLHSDLSILEVASAPYLASVERPGRLQVHAGKRDLPAACLPNSRTAAVVESLQAVLPMLTPASGVLESSFSDLGSVVNLPPALLGVAARDPEATVRDRLPQAVTATALRRLDAERAAIAFAYGVRDLDAAWERLARSYGCGGQGIDEVLDEIEAYGELPAPGPPGEDQRTHDLVASSLVPLVSAAQLAGVHAPTASALVDVASTLAGLDYMRYGRTLPSLGLDRLGTDGIRRALDGSDASLLAEVLA